MRSIDIKKLGIYAGILVAVVLFMAVVAYIFSHNKSYKNKATEQGGLCLNGIEYEECSSYPDCTITNVLICKTDQGGKLYEIKEYPDYQYIAMYHAWDGSIWEKASEKQFIFYF